MKIRSIIAVLWVASILGGGIQGSSVSTVRANRVAPSNNPTVSKATIFLNGIALTNGMTLTNGVALTNGMTLTNGVALTNGASRALALTALASRPLAKKD